MNMFGELAGTFSLWIDGVARIVSAPLANIKPQRAIEVIENDGGAFTMQLAAERESATTSLPPVRHEYAGGRLAEELPPEWAAAVRGGVVEILLRPARFVFRPLQLPNKAAEFLDGIIRAQIDRLTPWTASGTVFGWTDPREIARERIELTVVATGRETAVALAQAFSDLGAASVKIATDVPGEGRVAVLDQRAAGHAGFGRTRVALIAALAGTALLAVLSSGAGGLISDAYDTQQGQIQQQIAERRAVMRGNQTGGGGSALELLYRRKQTAPSSVMLIEALSALLPDHTYATEVRINGEKLQIIGVTRDAPSLIQILEQSPHFSSAGFFAPTTRGANESGERFYIEVRVKPYFGSKT